jgi:uncharacterized protein YjbI with pentapeptide repeats
MSLDPGRRHRLINILAKPEEDDFATLVHMSGLDPAQAFRGADLRKVDFGAANLFGFDVSGADLREANLTCAQGLEGLRYNDATRWPDGWWPPRPPDFLMQTMRMILSGQTPPVAWRPFIVDLSFDDSITPNAVSAGMVHVEGSEHFRNLLPLAALTALRRLWLSNTKVCDLTPLASLVALQSLDLAGTRVRDLTPLTALISLRFLHLTNTRVSDIAPIAGLKALRELYLSGTQVSDATPLQSLISIEELYLNGTKVNDLTPLSNLTSLRILGLNNTPVTDVAPLSRLPGLQVLDLHGTRVRDLSPLAQHKKLTIYGVDAAAQPPDRVGSSAIVSRRTPLAWRRREQHKVS